MSGHQDECSQIEQHVWQSGAVWAVTAAQVAVADTVGVINLMNKSSGTDSPGRCVAQ